MQRKQSTTFLIRACSLENLTNDLADLKNTDDVPASGIITVKTAIGDEHKVTLTRNYGSQNLKPARRVSFAPTLKRVGKFRDLTKLVPPGEIKAEVNAQETLSDADFSLGNSLCVIL